ncbi:MAG: PfkB family carbohydrate kinase [Rhodobacteraceae bacterium]|nr:PfkB family carbohydrate kinase [Paracoccaceae bacterium]
MPASPTVLVAGSLHHDIMIETDHLPRPDETAVGRRWYPKFGGKGGNQAVAAAHAGVAARMFGAVGEDDFGRVLRAALAAGGVDDRFVTTLPDHGSGMSVALALPNGDYAATIVSGANLALDPARLQDAALWQDVALLLLQNEVAEAINLAAATEARRRGLPVLLNAAPARPLPEALRAAVDILIVNAVEAAMMGADEVRDLATAEQAATALARPGQAVIVTAGGHGLALVTPEGTSLTLPATPVEVVSTHGAGDCFCGTLAAERARGTDLATACRIASTRAAAHVAGQGNAARIGQD